MTDRPELYIIVTKKASPEFREVGPLTVRGFGRARTNLTTSLAADEVVSNVVVRMVRTISEETHPIADADAVLKRIVAKGRAAEIDAEIERLVQERLQLQGELFPAEISALVRDEPTDGAGKPYFGDHDPA